MIIEKNGKYYEVAERAKYWSVTRRGVPLSVEVQVPKDICATEAEVKEYIKSEDIF